MAHANNNIIIGKLKGAVGKQLVFRDWDGKTVLAKSTKARTPLLWLKESTPWLIPVLQVVTF